MKSYVVEQSKGNLPEEYPVLMYWNGEIPDPGFVVMFLGYGDGVVMSIGKDSHYYVGQSVDGMAMSEFSVFTGTLHLSNY